MVIALRSLLFSQQGFNRKQPASLYQLSKFRCAMSHVLGGRQAGKHLHDVGDGEHDGAHIEIADGS